MIAKYIVLSNIISVVSNNILHICIQEPFLILRKIIVPLRTLSAYNSLLVRYKVYSYDPRECLCKSWRYCEAHENFSIDPASCRNNPTQKKTCHSKLSSPTTRTKLHLNKSLTAKVCLVWSLLLEKSYTEIKTWKYA